MKKMSKPILRQKLLKLLRSQNERVRLLKSRAIQRKLFKTPEFKRAQTVLFYASFDGEVETFEMMRKASKLKKKIALPIVMRQSKRLIPVRIKHFKDLKQGCYGILEPKLRKNAAKLADINLVVVPGVAFDKTNHRLGRGAGYYDRFLRKLPMGTPMIGLAFDFQIVDVLPHRKPHDVPVSAVITN